MTDIWVSNASPLITLASIDRLDLFGALRGEVRVPTTVLAEVAAGADGAADRVRQSGPFILVADVPVHESVAHWELDPGESMAVSLAIATQAKGVILDDLAGRRCAQSLGVRVIGTVGLIARAKRVGLISAAAPIIAAVRDAGLYVTNALVTEVLKDLGES